MIGVGQEKEYGREGKGMGGEELNYCPLVGDVR